MLLRRTQFIPLSFKQDLLVPLSPSRQGLHLPQAPLVEQEQKRTLLESVSMTKAGVNGFVQPQYFPWHIQAPVRFLFTKHIFIIYITTPNHVGVLLNVLSADSVAFVTVSALYSQFMICLALAVDNVHANILIPLCQLSLYVSFLP